MVGKRRKMLDYLASVTLAELVEKQRQKAAAKDAKSEAKTVSFGVAQAA